MDRMTKWAAVGVGVLALTTAALLTAAVTPEPEARATAGNTYETLAAEYNVTIDWFDRTDDACGNDSSGCIDFDSLDSISVMSGQINEWTRYVVIHEIGHVIQVREGGPDALNECDADAFAFAHGGELSDYSHSYVYDC
jgi:hypothetical protein